MASFPMNVAWLNALLLDYCFDSMGNRLARIVTPVVGWHKAIPAFRCNLLAGRRGGGAGAGRDCPGAAISGYSDKLVRRI
jgi:hypothetical protein